MSNREATTYNIVLGTHDDGSVVILEDVFRYSDSFQGATGSVIRPVTKADIKEAMSEKVEYLRELANDVDAHGWQRQQIVRMPKDEYLEHRFETVSIARLSTEEIAAKAGQETPERYTYDSLGRIFPRALEGIQLIDSEEVRAAVEAINAAEGISA